MDGNSSESTDKLLAATHKKYLIKYMPIIVIMCITTTMGIVGNIFTLLFYCSQSRKTSTIVFIIGLAGLDLIVCFMAITTIVDMSVNVYFTRSALCKAMYFFDHWFIVSSVLVLFIIAIDRYRKICRPVGRQFQIKTALITIFILIGISFGFAIPTLFMYDILTLKLTAPNGSFVFGNYCTNPDNPELKVLVTLAHIFDGLMVISILATFLVTYGKIWIVLRKHKQQTRKLTSHALASTEESTSERVIETDRNLDKSSNCDSTGVSPDCDQLATNNTSSCGNFLTVPKQHELPLTSDSTETIKKQENRANRPSRSERNITLMMLAVSVGYACCFTPYFIGSGIRIFTQAGAAEMEAWIQFLIRGPFFNSVINPFIFCYFNPKFRRYIKEKVIDCTHGRCMVNSANV